MVLFSSSPIFRQTERYFLVFMGVQAGSIANSGERDRALRVRTRVRGLVGAGFLVALRGDAPGVYLSSFVVERIASIERRSRE